MPRSGLHVVKRRVTACRHLMDFCQVTRQQRETSGPSSTDKLKWNVDVTWGRVCEAISVDRWIEAGRPWPWNANHRGDDDTRKTWNATVDAGEPRLSLVAKDYYGLLGPSLAPPPLFSPHPLLF